MSEKRLAGIALIATILLWAGYAVIARNVVQIFPPFETLLLRMGIGSLFFAPFLLKSKPWKKKSFKKLVLTSFFATVNVSFYIIGVKFTSASASQLIYSAMPIIIIVSGYYMRKETYLWNKWLGVIIGFLGLFFIMYRSSIEKGATITGTLYGNILVAVAMIGWMIWIIKSKSFSKYFTPLEIGAVSCTTSFLASILFAGIEYSVLKPNLILSPSILLSCLYLGGVGTFLTYILYQYAISKVSTLSASMTSYLQPIATTILASYFIGEKINLSFLVGGVLVLLGVFVSQSYMIIRSSKSS